MSDGLLYWHRYRFPEATATDVLLKLMEEVGELASAILGEQLGGKGVAIDELGDVLVCAAVLAERFMGISVDHLLKIRVENVIAR